MELREKIARDMFEDTWGFKGQFETIGYLPKKFYYDKADLILQAIRTELLSRMPKEKRAFGGTYADVQVIIGENLMLKG